MTSTQTQQTSAEFTISLGEEERSQLLDWLQQWRRTKLVEEHRTDAADYKKFVVRQEAILDKLINKLQRH